MKQGNDLSWPQVVMAANAPMMTKAALVDGRTDVGVLPTGQVVGEIGELPTVAELDRPHHGRGRTRARPPRRVVDVGPSRAPERPHAARSRAAPRTPPVASAPRRRPAACRIDRGDATWPRAMIAHCVRRGKLGTYSLSASPHAGRSTATAPSSRPTTPTVGCRSGSHDAAPSVITERPGRSDVGSSRPVRPPTRPPGARRPVNITGVGAVTGLRLGHQAHVGRLPARGERRPADHRARRLRRRRRGLPRHASPTRATGATARAGSCRPSASPPARPSPTPPNADGSRAGRSGSCTASCSATSRCGATSTVEARAGPGHAAGST